tara:strand:- start:4654 stop:4899 length:246 start_codon:yes stop_codon:yes gene_type:complete
MAQVEYLGKFALSKTYDEPTAIVRRIRDKGMYVVEICNEKTPWRADPDLIRHFWGLSDNAYPISVEKASRIIETWQAKWFN